MKNIFLLGFVYLFIAHTAGWSPIVGVIVCLAVYFVEILIDNNYARMKWQIAINASWIVAITLGFVNLLVLYFMG